MARPRETFILLHNIRSAQNVGAIFRTADATGVSKIFLSGYTPQPIDRFGRNDKTIAKTALGAEHTIAWEYFASPIPLLKKLKKSGAQIVAVEQDKHSIDYKKVKIKYPAIFVFGNEVDGISKQILKIADIIAEIPMRGKKESLNVSVAAGVVLFKILKI